MKTQKHVMVLLLLVCCISIPTFAQEKPENKEGVKEAPLRKMETQSEIENILSDIDIDEQAIEQSIDMSLMEVQNSIEASLSDLEVELERLEIDLSHMETELDAIDISMPELDFDAIMDEAKFDIDVDVDLDFDATEED